MQTGVKNEDAGKFPERLTIKIPVTYNIAIIALRVVDTLHSGKVRLAARAAFALGCRLSFRQGQKLTCQANASIDLSSFWYSDDEYNVCTALAYPPDQLPDIFSVMIHQYKEKNDKSGHGGPRSIARNLHYDFSPDTFCVVRELFNYLRFCPPEPQSPLLSGIGTQLFDVRSGYRSYFPFG
jgi:hypothetical protein